MTIEKRESIRFAGNLKTSQGRRGMLPPIMERPLLPYLALAVSLAALVLAVLARLP